MKPLLEKDISGTDLLKKLQWNEPSKLFAIYKGDSAIAIYANGQWIPLFGKLIDGNWHKIGMQVLVNGKPAYNQEDWRVE